jgi:hypothetical protein
VDRNGIHSSKVRFCSCRGAVERPLQLVQAGLFPASVTQPQTAFTFAALQHFQMLNLQAKVTAFDYISTLRQITDGVRTHKVPVSITGMHRHQSLTSPQDPYKSFLRVTRIWDYLTRKKEAGLASGVNTQLASRPDNSMVVYCPACPEPGTNMPEEWKEIPPSLRYILSEDPSHKLTFRSGILLRISASWTEIIGRTGTLRTPMQAIHPTGMEEKFSATFRTRRHIESISRVSQLRRK